MPKKNRIYHRRRFFRGNDPAGESGREMRGPSRARLPFNRSIKGKEAPERCRENRSLTVAARFSAGFSLAETLMAILIVSGLLVVAMNTAGASRVAQQSLGERGVGQLLALSLMSEIQAQPYQDRGAALFGREIGELVASRATFDDVDDYDGWMESPPLYKDGSEIPDRAGWRRSVAVALVKVDNPNQTVLIDEGAKRITVTVTHNGREITILMAVRTDEPEAPEALQELF